MTAEAIATPRLRLIPLPEHVLEALLNQQLGPAAELLGASPPSWWPAENGSTMEMRRVQLHDDPTELPWLLRGMVTHAQPAMVVGQIGFHAPPDRDGMVEIGYTVFPDHRRQGYAEEASRAMIGWAAATPSVTRVRASVSPDNHPSLNLVAKLGLVHIGEQMDEIDGLELVFEREVYPGERPASGAGRSPETSV